MKGATEKLLVRLTPEEKWMADSIRQELGCSLNDAIRVCVRRGWARVEPGGTVDAPVLDPNWSPANAFRARSVPTITGQTELDITEEEGTTNEQ